MTVRFACAASALTLASALSAPAFAQGPGSTTVEAAATAIVAASNEDEIKVFDLGQSAAPATKAIPVGTGTGEIAVTAAALAAAAQDTDNGGRSDSFTVVLNQDSFFGFYPSFNGLIPVSENVDFSFYGILWTTDAFGTGLGSDLWTEFGVGAAIYSGGFVIKPQIGLTNGALLSRGVRGGPNNTPTGTGGNFADGIVPSLTVNYLDDTFEAEYYGGYYAAFRNRNDVGSLDFLHTWINAGYRFSDKISAGAHYELLSNTRNQGGATARVYQWVGPYVQFKTSNGFFARFTAGADIESGNDGDFYKLSAGFTF
ncbi:MAG: DUF6733 family protein [Erythrobacter sp.]